MTREEVLTTVKHIKNALSQIYDKKIETLCAATETEWGSSLICVRRNAYNGHLQIWVYYGEEDLLKSLDRGLSVDDIIFEIEITEPLKNNCPMGDYLQQNFFHRPVGYGIEP